MTALARPKLGLCASSYKSGRSCERTGEFLLSGGFGDDFRSLWSCGDHLENVVTWLLERTVAPSLQIIAANHDRPGQ